MDKEALKALGLTDEQVAKIHEDYGKNYVTKTQSSPADLHLQQKNSPKGVLGFNA